MINSLPRLIDGMVATLREAILPHVGDQFARGQAFGVIYMLNSIRLRAEWSNKFLGEQLRALEDLSRELALLSPALDHAPLPEVMAPADLPSANDLERLRDEGDARVCALIDWLADHGSAMPDATAARIDEALRRYIDRQLRWEMSTSAKPMFEEISTGADKES